ncbi:unnamed protein product [Pleuronectes platessa]|uniref:Uncharacterized protein n=1 Tax=Pleuronectes platessa TaxID=8262 RepID=A0A9N7YE32_PLEPL|nr:unnamed protein product [Pleuronectes platessa]
MCQLLVPDVDPERGLGLVLSQCLKLCREAQRGHISCFTTCRGFDHQSPQAELCQARVEAHSLSRVSARRQTRRPGGRRGTLQRKFPFTRPLSDLMNYSLNEAQRFLQLVKHKLRSNSHLRAARARRASLAASGPHRSPGSSLCLGGGRACFLDQAKHGPPERGALPGPGRFWPDGHRQ